MFGFKSHRSFKAASDTTLYSAFVVEHQRLRTNLDCSVLSGFHDIDTLCHTFPRRVTGYRLFYITTYFHRCQSSIDGLLGSNILLHIISNPIIRSSFKKFQRIGQCQFQGSRWSIRKSFRYGWSKVQYAILARCIYVRLAYFILGAFHIQGDFFQWKRSLISGCQYLKADNLLIGRCRRGRNNLGACLKSIHRTKFHRYGKIFTHLGLPAFCRIRSRSGLRIKYNGQCSVCRFRTKNTFGTFILVICRSQWPKQLTSGSFSAINFKFSSWIIRRSSRMIIQMKIAEFQLCNHSFRPGNKSHDLIALNRIISIIVWRRILGTGKVPRSENGLFKCTDHWKIFILHRSETFRITVRYCMRLSGKSDPGTAAINHFTALCVCFQIVCQPKIIIPFDQALRTTAQFESRIPC